MKKMNKKVLSGLAGAMMLANGCAPGVSVDKKVEEQSITADVPVKEELTEVDGYTIAATPIEQVSYVKVADAQGTFAFDQNVLSPSDDIFNIFGTAVTGLCASPSFAVEQDSDTVGEYYINVSGDMKSSYRVTLDGLKSKTENKVMSCSCATSPMVVNTTISGVPLSAVLEMAELNAGANTITFRGADGYGLPMSLSYALEQNAMLVYQINEENLPAGMENQLWMPGLSAQYFTRNVLNIEVTAEEEIPEVREVSEENRAKIFLMNTLSERTLPIGEPVTFEGYADDCGKAIQAIQVSLDGGETWATFETEGTTAEKWVYWYYTFTPDTAGIYKLMVQAVGEDGTVSPLAASVFFTVE